MSHLLGANPTGPRAPRPSSIRTDSVDHHQPPSFEEPKLSSKSAPLSEDHEQISSAGFESLQRLVGRVRTSRANARLAENVRLSAAVRPLQADLREVLEETSSLTKGLANLESLSFVDSRPEGMVAFVDPAFELYLDLGKHVDFAAERRRIDKEIADTRGKLEQVTRKLEVVEEQRARDQEYREILRKLEEMKREYGESAWLLAHLEPGLTTPIAGRPSGRRPSHGGRESMRPRARR
jgi:valyl-tRNA synthetase